MKLALYLFALLALWVPAHGFLFGESPGDRALKEAEAERIQTENRMAERSHAYVLAQAREPKRPVKIVARETGVPVWMFLVMTALGALAGILLIREERRRETAELELERYQVFYGRAYDLLTLEYRNRGGAEAVEALLLEEH